MGRGGLSALASKPSRRLGRTPDTSGVVDVLRQHARPAGWWHLPALISASEAEGLQRRSGGATREHMLRELTEAVDVLTAVSPLILVLEDMHWSDTATLDWLSYVARRWEPARLLILGTYPPPRRFRARASATSRGGGTAAPPAMSGTAIRLVVTSRG